MKSVKCPNKCLSIFIGSGLLLFNVSQADALKLYHCQSTDGTVIIQDRKCAATRLHTVKPDNNQKTHQKAAPGTSHTYQPKRPSQGRFSPNEGISPQVFIDVVKGRNWPSQLTHNGHGWQLIIDIPGQESANQGKQGSRISVEYFRDTEATLNKDAFSYALNLYHEIRHQYRLIDSQFKSHPGYKVFNVSYQISRLPAYTEFYMGKLDGSLWVFTLKDKSDNNLLARQIMMQLQALV